jgi:hypothetical protein
MKLEKINDEKADVRMNEALMIEWMLVVKQENDLITDVKIHEGKKVNVVLKIDWTTRDLYAWNAVKNAWTYLRNH